MNITYSPIVCYQEIPVNISLSIIEYLVIKLIKSNPNNHAKSQFVLTKVWKQYSNIISRTEKNSNAKLYL